MLTNIFAQNPGDTIVVQTFDYSMTYGSGPWSGGNRDTIAYFPNDPNLTFEKIILSYNMRCKDNVINTSGQANHIGCGAWDYSCNTYIHDSTRVDSILTNQASHTISNFNGTTYNYSNNPVYNYTQYIQQTAIINSIILQDTIKVGVGTDSLDFVIATMQNAHKSQFLFRADELLNFGLSNDTINAISLNVISGNNMANFLSIKLKLTTDSVLSNTNPHTGGFTEVYKVNTLLTSGINRFQFTNAFVWDSVSNIILEFSLTNSTTNGQTLIQGDTSFTACALHTNDANYIEVNGSEHIDVPHTPMSSVNDEITVSLWVYGDENVLPVNTYLLEAFDGNNKRTVNIHFPWSNGRIYWDCGNTGGTYDRIDKAANLNEYAGGWSHWAFTKNAITGDMKIYRNGVLWHSGTGLTNTMDIQSFKVCSNGNGSSTFWDGKLKDLQIFDSELSQATIQNWMYNRLDVTHPNYANLVAYYPFNEGVGTTANDNSINAQTASFNGNVLWRYDRGEDLGQFFTLTNMRPNIDFYQGTYNLTITTDTILDSLMATANTVNEYTIVPNWGTLQNDSIANISTNIYWEAINYTYDTSGAIINTTATVIDGTINITNLSYYKRYPMAFQIMSFVTPYGAYLDLGVDGKTWYFDITDFSPVLKGAKRITMDAGGQWQEDMDIKFLFIVGTPPRDVIEMQNIWKVQSKNYTQIQNDDAFENKDVLMNTNATAYKIRTAISGHGQEGEFIPQNHTLNIDGGAPEFTWQVWTECADNPVYPQGGTWIYDRAGWCPGKPTDLEENDITSLVTSGQIHNLDYSILGGTGTSKYWVSSQLVSYGSPNFTLDAAIVEVLSPTDKVLYSRTNPICSNPKVVIQNTGSTILTSLTIDYWINNATTPETFSWSGSLGFLEKQEVELPSSASLWQSMDTINNIFYVEVKSPNASTDQYIHNNLFKSTFAPTPVYPSFFGLCIQTNSGTSMPFISETTWDIYDGQGNTIYTSGPLSWGTQYRDTILLSPGCYRFEVQDTDDDGLDFWANNDGSGVVRFITTPISCNAPEVNYFEPDFGKYIIHEFRVENITSTEDQEKYPWKIFPNPTKESIFIVGFINEKTSILLFNNLGKIVMKTEVNFQGVISNQMDISHLPMGVYFIHIKNSTEKIIKKVVKL